MPASPFTRTSVALSIREDDGIRRIPVDGLVVTDYPELAVTRGYQTTRGIWHVTHAPTGLTVTRSLSTERAAEEVALAIARAMTEAGVRVGTDDGTEAGRRFQSVPAAMAIIQSVR
jgi:hypothetical protein